MQVPHSQLMPEDAPGPTKKVPHIVTYAADTTSEAARLRVYLNAPGDRHFKPKQGGQYYDAMTVHTYRLVQVDCFRCARHGHDLLRPMFDVAACCLQHRCVGPDGQPGDQPLQVYHGHLYRCKGCDKWVTHLHFMSGEVACEQQTNRKELWVAWATRDERPRPFDPIGQCQMSLEQAIGTVLLWKPPGRAGIVAEELLRERLAQLQAPQVGHAWWGMRARGMRACGMRATPV